MTLSGWSSAPDAVERFAAVGVIEHRVPLRFEVGEVIDDPLNHARVFIPVVAFVSGVLECFVAPSDHAPLLRHSEAHPRSLVGFDQVQGCVLSLARGDDLILIGDLIAVGASRQLPVIRFHKHHAFAKSFIVIHRFSFLRVGEPRPSLGWFGSEWDGVNAADQLFHEVSGVHDLEFVFEQGVSVVVVPQVLEQELGEVNLWFFEVDYGDDPCHGVEELNRGVVRSPLTRCGCPVDGEVPFAH